MTALAQRFALRVSIDKARSAAATGDLAFGWASTITIDGRPVIDHDGEIIPVEALEPAVYDYLEKSRAAGVLHAKDASGKPVSVGHIVESLFLSLEKAQAMGLDTGGREGWWVGFRITDQAVLAKVRSGELSEFSIGGSCEREDHPSKPGVGVLSKIKITEVSFVDAGAGLRVPVTLVKERKGVMNKELKKRLEAGFAALKMEKAKTDPIIGKLEKAEVLTLADIAGKLSEEEMAVVLQAIEAAKMTSAAPGAEGAEPVTKDEPAAANSQEDENPTPMGKAHKALQKQLAEEKAARQAMEKSLNKALREAAEERATRRLEKAKTTVASDLKAIVGDRLELAKALVALDEIEAADGGAVIIAGSVAKTLRKALQDASRAIEESPFFEELGKGGRGGEEPGPIQTLEKRVKELRDKDGKLTKAKAEMRVFEEDRDLYEAVKDARAKAN